MHTTVPGLNVLQPSCFIVPGSVSFAEMIFTSKNASANDAVVAGSFFDVRHGNSLVREQDGHHSIF